MNLDSGLPKGMKKNPQRNDGSAQETRNGSSPFIRHLTRVTWGPGLTLSA